MNPYYEDDLVRLYHGDCREVTAWLEADVLVTDPPYGMTLRSSRNGAFGDNAIANDETLEARDSALALWGGSPSPRLRSLVRAPTHRDADGSHVGEG